MTPDSPGPRSADGQLPADDLAVTVSGLDPTSVASVIDAASCLICVFDRGRDLVLYNRECERTTGFTKEEVGVGGVIRTLVPPEEQEECRRVAIRARAGESPIRHEHHVVTKNGDRRLISWTITALPGQSGALEYLVVTGVDITEQRAAERSARASHDRLELLHEIAVAAIAGCSVDEIVERAVDKLASCFPTYRATYETIDLQDRCTVLASSGSTRSPTGAMTVSASRATSDLATLRRGEVLVIEDAVEDGRPGALVAGPARAVLAVPLAHGEQLLGALCVSGLEPHRWDEHEVRTVTEAAEGLAIAIHDVHADEARREGENRFRAIADSAPVLVWMCDAAGTASFFNRGWLEFTGRSLADELAGSGWDSLHPDDVAWARKAFGIALRTGEGYELEYRLRRADGEYRWLLDHALPRLRPGGGFAGLTGVAIDITERRQAIEALRENEERMRTLVDMQQDALERLQASEEQTRLIVQGAPDAVITVRADGTISGWNPQAEAVFGWSAAEVVGRPLLETIIPQRRPSQRDASLRDVLEGRLAPIPRRRIEIEAIDRTGQAFPVELSVTALDAEAEHGFAAFVRDITEQRRAEQDVGRRQAILQAVSAGAGWLLLDPFADEAVLAMLEELGRAAEISRAYVFQNVPREGDAPLHSLRYEWCADGITPAPEISDLEAIPYFDRWDERLPTGEVINAHVADLSVAARAILEPQGNKSLLVVPIFAGAAWWGFLGFDETQFEREWSQAEIEALRAAAGIIGASIERRRAEDALLESEARFRQFAENVDEGFWLDKPDGRVLYVNRAFTTITGRSAETFYRDPSVAESMVHPDDRERTRAAFDRYLSQPYDVQYRVVRPDGSERWVRDRCFHVLDEHGAVFRIAGIMLDITDRKRENEERRQLEEQMRHAQKLESLGILAGGIAHDFNNLLMGVLGNAGLALAELPPGSPVRATVEQIETAALRAAELTNQMLAYAGKGRFVVEPVDLSRLVEEIAHLLSAAISKKAVLRFELGQDLPPVHGDATQLRQVVMNLITNASDALGEETGVITVRTGVRAVSAHELASSFAGEGRQAGSYTLVEVVDTGCGMDGNTTARIFDPFFTTKFTGRGLGLAGALGIVRSHGGAIQVDSTLGRGTRISVLLPQADRIQAVTERTRPAVSDYGEPATVLVIDDEETVRAVATAVLERSGFSVLTAINGRQGLDLLREHAADIDVVLLDMTMPDMGGHEVFATMRRLHPDVRVVVSSGYTEEDARRQIGARTAGFIQKPYRPQELVEHLRRALIP